MNNQWTVYKSTKGGDVQLISNKNVEGILPVGSYLTVLDKQDTPTYILQIIASDQSEPYNPSPILIDTLAEKTQRMVPDQKCQNIVTAKRVKQLSKRSSNLIGYIPPQQYARKSTQEEINKVFENKKGVPLFPAGVYGNVCETLLDDKDLIYKIFLDDEFYFEQSLVFGKTGSGKTVALKYLIQYFIDVIGGAVLVANVKREDLLTMTEVTTKNIENRDLEWKSLAEIKDKERADFCSGPHGIVNSQLFYPKTAKEYRRSSAVLKQKPQPISLSIENLEPESISGVLLDMGEGAATIDICDFFRYWQDEEQKPGESIKAFRDFLENEYQTNKKIPKKDVNGVIDSQGKIHPSTFSKIIHRLGQVFGFFDVPKTVNLTVENILQKKTLTVIDLYGEELFGAILLQDILQKIQKSKPEFPEVPILIVIDEVHKFYNSQSSVQALESINRFVREGRSSEIGVILASQNPRDIDTSIHNTVMTKIFFNSSRNEVAKYGLTNDYISSESLKKGYAIILSNYIDADLVKFPVAFCGVV